MFRDCLWAPLSWAPYASSRERRLFHLIAVGDGSAAALATAEVQDARWPATHAAERGIRLVLPSAQSKQTTRQQGDISFAVVKWL